MKRNRKTASNIAERKVKSEKTTNKSSRARKKTPQELREEMLKKLEKSNLKEK